MKNREGRMGARGIIRDFFEKNVGKIVTTKQIRRVAKISEYARRIRELRDEEGMQIKSHKDRHDLHPGQYILEDLHRIPVISRGISPQLRNEILERNGFTCQLCGAAGGDPDPSRPGKRVRLEVDHIVPISQGGSEDRSNLRALCSVCNLSRSNVQTASESARNLLARIRRSARSVQKEVYEAMKKTFES
jgi:5-methylcytosine-specific restriction endonuclease McrA